MAISTVDQIVAALAAGGIYPIWKPSATSTANTYHSLWTAAGFPGAGAAAGSASGAACTSATTGALPFPNAGASEQRLVGLDVQGAGTYHFILYDRLVHTSALSGTVTTAQTVNSAALTRYTTGEYVEAWLEWYTATGGTASNVTMSYTNQANTSGRTSVSIAMPTTLVAGRMMAIPLAAGDYGVRSVQSLTLSASTGTAGNFGITLMRRLASGILNTALPLQADWASLGMPKILDDACLSMLVFTSASSTGAMAGQLITAVG